MSESDPSHSPGGNTDDLLAQLAGEEVDRLLAEADVSQTPTPQATDHVDEQEAAALKSLLEESAQKELDEIDRGQAGNGGEFPNDPRAGDAGAQEDVSSQLDQLFAALTNSKKDREPEPQPPPPTAPSPAVAEQAAVELEEKAALEEEDLQHQEPQLPHNTPLAWWMWPLAWINMPFASVSQKTKEKLGWIGVQTIIFALLILAYVWWLRGKK